MSIEHDSLIWLRVQGEVWVRQLLCLYTLEIVSPSGDGISRFFEATDSTCFKGLFIASLNNCIHV